MNHQISSTAPLGFFRGFKHCIVTSFVFMIFAFLSLLIPVVGWILSPFLFILSIAHLLGSPFYGFICMAGACPYCGNHQFAMKRTKSFKCTDCKQRILVRNDSFVSL